MTASDESARDLVKDMIEKAKKRIGICSPSKTFVEAEGLMVGYRYGTSIATGMQSVFKSSDFRPKPDDAS